MAYVSKAQILTAREMDLLTYLRRYMPDELVKTSSGTYATRTHDSLKISNGKWYWWSQKIGGVSALDYLVKVRGMPFPAAVEHLTNGAGAVFICERQTAAAPREPPQTVHSRDSPEQADSNKMLLLPPRFENNRRVFAYLASRGIDGEVINHCIKHGILYEDAEKHNAIFVGYDGDTPRYGFVRSTLSKSTFMRELTGSDKRFGFQLSAQESDVNKVYVFESAIDALSFASILKRDGMDWRMVHYLSLGGAVMRKDGLPPALAQFLKNHPKVNKVALCLDNDRTGRETAQAVIAAVPELQAAYIPPTTGKDFNEMLCAMKGITSRAKMRGHKEEVR